MDAAANGFSMNTVLIVASGLTAAVTTIQLISLINKLYAIYRLYQTTSLLCLKGYSVLSLLVHVSQASRCGTGLVGLIMGIVMVWGMIGYILGTTDLNKYQTRAVIAYGIAATVVAILFFALLFFPVVGILLVLFITLFDSVVFLVCEIVQSDSDVCKSGKSSSATASFPTIPHNQLAAAFTTKAHSR